MTEEVLYSARHWSDEAKAHAQEAYTAVGQVGNGIIPVICCSATAPTAFTAYQVEKTSDEYVSNQQYYWVKASGSGDVPEDTPIYSDKWCLYEAYCHRFLDSDPQVSVGSARWGTHAIEFEYTGTTHSNSLSNGDMYYNTTDNKIYTYNSSTSSWGSGVTVTDTILVLDRNTNKLMHLWEGHLEGVYRL
jgi:hypothetical protein